MDAISKSDEVLYFMLVYNDAKRDILWVAWLLVQDINQDLLWIQIQFKGYGILYIILWLLMKTKNSLNSYFFFNVLKILIHNFIFKALSVSFYNQTHERMNSEKK